MIVDMHAHLGEWFGKPLLVEELIKSMDESSVDVSCISMLNALDKVLDGKAMSMYDAVKADNDGVFEAMNAYPDRIVGFAHISPRSAEEAVKELDRTNRKLKFKGVKLHPEIDHFSLFDERTYRVMEKIEELRIPVLIHTGQPRSTPLQVAYVARDFPKIPAVILGHMGLSTCLPQSLPAAKLCDNIYLDTSVVGELPYIENAVKELGAERVLWGSDLPFNYHAPERKKIEALQISEEDKRKILGENATRLLQLEV